MKNNITKISAKRFLSIGDEGVTVDFRNLKKIIHVIGENRDSGTNKASNGSGKSALLETIVYGLYGKLLKNINHKEAINVFCKKGLEIIIDFTIDNANYQVVRRRKPDELLLYKDGENISLGGIPATQQLLEGILCLNYESFINISFFGQHSPDGFLASDPGNKRKIVENLLLLDRFTRYLDKTKKYKQAINEKIKTNTMLYDESTRWKEQTETKLQQLIAKENDWLQSKKNSIKITKLKIQEITEKITTEQEKNSDTSSELEKLEKIISEQTEMRSKVYEYIEKVLKKISLTKEKIAEKKSEIARNNRNISILKKEIIEISEHIKEIENKHGGKCPTCLGVVNKDNFSSIISKNKELIKEKYLACEEGVKLYDENYLPVEEEKIVELEKTKEDLMEKEISINEKIRNSLDKKQKIINNLSNLNLIQQLTVEKLSLEERLKSLHEDIIKNPYKELISNLTQEISEKTKNLEDIKLRTSNLSSELPYIDFWIKGFGDYGIRSHIIAELIPSINNRINYWMQFLLENKIKITLNENLEESIDKIPSDGSNFLYNGLSGGEHKRVDLAISQSFANIMMNLSNCCPSIVALDEVGVNFDRPGIHAVYRMIEELSQDRQVLVVTHDPDLQEMLQGTSQIKCILENKCTRIEINH